MHGQARWLVGSLTVVVLASACAQGGTGGGDPSSASRDGSILRISTGDGLVGVRAASGEIAYRAGRAVSTASGSLLYRTEATGPDTGVIGLGGDDGEVRSRHVVTGSLDVRAVGADGRLVVMAPPRPPGSDRYRPVPKDRSTLVVLDTVDGSERSIELAGNYEPEALSTDGAAVFVVEFTPPMSPDRYRVRRLDLATNTVGDVASRDKELQRNMRGSARRQVMARDGRRLYTLYTLVEADGTRRAFVHVLDLHDQWAHCVDLPGSVGAGTEQAVALALDKGGRRLFVLDRDRGRLAEVDTTALSVVASRPLPSALPPRGQLLAATDGERLYAATGPTVVAFDRSTGAGLHRFELPRGSPAVDLVVGGGAAVYVSSGTALWRVEASAGSLRGVPLQAGTKAVLPPQGGGSRSTLQCAC